MKLSPRERQLLRILGGLLAVWLGLQVFAILWTALGQIADVLIIFGAAWAFSYVLSPLVDRINDRYGRCTIGFGLLPPEVRGFKGHAAFQRVPESWEF